MYNNKWHYIIYDDTLINDHIRNLDPPQYKHAKLVLASCSQRIIIIIITLCYVLDLTE